MPDYLRFPIKLVTLGFDLIGVARRGRPFHAQSHSSRWRQIESWRTSPFLPVRDFIRFYESLVLYYWYSEDER